MNYISLFLNLALKEKSDQATEHMNHYKSIATNIEDHLKEQNEVDCIIISKLKLVLTISYFSGE